MAYSSFVGSFNIDTTKTAGQTQAITGVGFTPKIVMFWWGGSTGTGDGVAGGTINVGFGAGISSSSRFAVDSISVDASATEDSFTSQNNTECIRCYTDTATLDGIADFTSCDADGFTLTIDDQFTQAYRISYLALGGTELTNVFIGNKQIPAANGNYGITGVGFLPDAVLLLGAGLNSVAGTGNNGHFTLGMATSSSARGVVSTYELDAQTSSYAKGYGINSECFAYAQNIDRHDFVSMDADGFTVNQIDYAVQRYYFYICLKGGQYLVGDLTTRTDGNDIAETVGFQPVAILFASANRALSTADTATNHAAVSIGAGTSTSNRACAAIWAEHNLADTETARANYDTAVYANVADDATVGLMDIKSIDATGFTCVMDDTDPSACWVTYLAIGSTEVSHSESPSTSASVSPSTSASVSPSTSESVSPSVSPSTSESASPSPSTSESASPSISESVSPSTSESASPSMSESPSPSTSESASPSMSESASPSMSESASPSISESPSPSVSESQSPSVSESPSPSTSESASPSPSTSESASPSVSESVSPSISPSVSESPSPSVSESASPSISPSTSESASPSAGPLLEGSVCYGHDTGVTETNVVNFGGYWTGTGTIEDIGVDDTERLKLDPGEYMEAQTVYTGAYNITLDYNHYGVGDVIVLKYRHGATQEDCEAAAYAIYAGPFDCLGYVQVRVEATT